MTGEHITQLTREILTRLKKPQKKSKKTFREATSQFIARLVTEIQSKSKWYSPRLLTRVLMQEPHSTPTLIKHFTFFTNTACKSGLFEEPV